MVSNDDRNLGVLAHVLSIFTGFLGPLIIYLAVENKKKFAKENAKNALNFQLTVIIAYIISFILIFVLIGIFLIFVVFLLDIIFCIVAATNTGKSNVAYKYPLAINFLK